ncbi:MAG: hypothetical protein ABW321_23495 [Polyangiales bacterium]
MRRPSAPLYDEAEPIRVDFAPDDVSLFWVENVAIMVWHRPVTAPVLEALHALAAPRRAQYPSGMSFVHLGQVQMSMMDSATRDVFVRVLRELNTYMAATAVVAKASGFWASTVRSVVTGILVLSRVSHETRFHEHAEELLDWLPAKHEQITGIKLDNEQLRRVLLKAEASL